MKPTGLEAKTGRFLVAHPQMRDNFFSFAVIYLTQVNSEGCEGFVLNKLLPLNLEEALPNIPIGKNRDVFLGGPVDKKSLYFLHGKIDNNLRSEKIDTNIFHGYSYTDLLAVLDGKNVPLFCCLGYSGWSEGQLAHEIKNNDWLVADLDLWALLRTESSQIWSIAMGQLGQDYLIWQHHPLVPSWN